MAGVAGAILVCHPATTRAYTWSREEKEEEKQGGQGGRSGRMKWVRWTQKHDCGPIASNTVTVYRKTQMPSGTCRNRCLRGYLEYLDGRL